MARPEEMSAPAALRHTEQCAARIKAYWEERGARVTVRVVNQGYVNGAGGLATFVIRSDLRGGLPTGTGDIFVGGAKPPARARRAASLKAETRHAKTLDILRAVKRPLSAGDLACRLGVGWQAMRNDLGALLEAGLVARTPSGRAGRVEWSAAHV